MKGNPILDGADSRPVGWKIDRLKDISTINGHSLPAGTSNDFEFNYLEISNVDYYGIINKDAIERLRFEDAPSRARRIVSMDSVLASSVRPNLQAITKSYADPELVCSTGFNVIDAHKKYINPQFLYFSILSEITRQYFESVATGVGYPAVNDKDFGSTNILFPSLKEQNLIATFLGASCATIDAAISAKRKQVETMFTLLKVTISRAMLSGLDPSVVKKYSGQDYVGDIPEHWEAKCLKRLIGEPLTYGLNEAAELDDRELPRYLRITDFDDDGTLRDETFRSLPEEIACEAPLVPGDVLFARSGATVGKCFYFIGYKGKACFAGYLIRARTTKWKMRSEYLYYFTKTFAYESWKNLIFTQATIQNISATKYDYLLLPVPPLKEQDEIIEFVKETNIRNQKLISIINSQISTLLAYRKSLIHECVTGKRRVTEADLERVRA